MATNVMFSTNDLGILTWSQLPTSGAAFINKTVWCSDYPSVNDTGAKLICDGTRWKPVTMEHTIITQYWAAGLTIAAASAEAILGSVVKTVPGGAIKPGDTLVMQIVMDGVADAAAAQRLIRIRSHTTSSVTAGSVAMLYIGATTTSTGYDLDKMTRVLSNTVGRQGATGQPGAYSSASATASAAFADLSATSYMGITVTNNCDTETLTMYHASLSVRFGS